MVKTPLSLKSKDVPKELAAPAEADDSEVVERHTQRKRPDSGRYRLQVDRQTKASYGTFEEAEAQGLLIKKRFEKVQVAIYDTQASANTVLEMPA
jgi:hypothetical protein